MPDSEALGKRLRLAREAQGLTQQQVATKAGLSVSYINQVEHGNKTPYLVN